MRKLFAVLSLGVVAGLAGCTEGGVDPLGPGSTSFNETTVPTSNGPTWVTGSFDLTLTFDSGDAGVNKHPQGKGSCRNSAGEVDGDPEQNTFWHAPGASEATTGAKFCQPSSNGGDPQVVECTTDAIPAVYAFGGSGAPTGDQGGSNENLNFIGVEFGETGTFVHYNASRNRLTKQGTLTVDFTCEPGDVEGTATINLAQITGGFKYVSSTSRQLTGVKFVTEVNGQAGEATGTLDWEYRSRNDIPPTTP